MNDPIPHLPGISATVISTPRLRTLLLISGPSDGEPVLFLHGNLASSTFWEETMLALPQRFRTGACDLRGYGLSDPEARIDATRGFADWADDALALADQLGWDRFHVVAHSLGGCVAWSLLALHPHRIRSATLVAPGPPCGFGGARGERGELNHEDGAGSGAALVHPTLVERLAAGEREVSDDLFSPRAVMNRLYWKPPFRPEREDELLDAMLQVHLGEGCFPGDWRPSPHWPGFAPGVIGPINALSPRYNQWVLPALIKAEPKPPLLWVCGTDDPIVCDGSFSDIGTQGKLGVREGWPGDDLFPPQPLLSQVTYAVNQYEQAGGAVQRLVLPAVGHTPYLEQPASFQSALINHLQAR
jgi:pimeloyl-ACP methyl ester carboxylesterase